MQLPRLVFNDILFALYGANLINWSTLTRTNFQKILFFCATLSPMIDIEWGYTFTNFSYGPFNRDVHQAPELLIPYGYIEMVNFKYQKDSKVRATYKITDLGNKEVDLISMLSKERKRRDWIILVMNILDIYGPKMVVKLAYQEPTFSEIRKQNQKVINLSKEQNLSLHLIDKISTTLDKDFNTSLDSVTSKLIVYFDFISKDIATGKEGG